MSFSIPYQPQYNPSYGINTQQRHDRFARPPRYTTGVLADSFRSQRKERYWAKVDNRDVSFILHRQQPIRINLNFIKDILSGTQIEFGREAYNQYLNGPRINSLLKKIRGLCYTCLIDPQNTMYEFRMILTHVLDNELRRCGVEESIIRERVPIYMRKLIPALSLNDVLVDPYQNRDILENRSAYPQRWMRELENFYSTELGIEEGAQRNIRRIPRDEVPIVIPNVPNRDLDMEGYTTWLKSLWRIESDGQVFVHNCGSYQIDLFELTNRCKEGAIFARNKSSIPTFINTIVRQVSEHVHGSAENAKSKFRDIIKELLIIEIAKSKLNVAKLQPLIDSSVNSAMATFCELPSYHETPYSFEVLDPSPGYAPPLPPRNGGAVQVVRRPCSEPVYEDLDSVLDPRLGVELLNNVHYGTFV